MIVYDIANRNSFQEEVAHHHEQLVRIKDLPGAEVVPCILVGNKNDLEEKRVVAVAEGAAMAQKLGIPAFIETSAKNRVNVDEAFFNLVRLIRGGGGDTTQGKKKKDKKRCMIM